MSVVIHCFANGSKMASCFDTCFLEDDICAIHEPVVKNKINTKKTTNFNLACQCSLVGRKLFSRWICNKIVKCTGQNPPNVCKL